MSFSIAGARSIRAWGPNSIASRAYSKASQSKAASISTIKSFPLVLEATPPGSTAGHTSGPRVAELQHVDPPTTFDITGLPAPPPEAPQIAFISGPLEAGDAYFYEHYAFPIIDAINAGHHFIIGPSRGIDTLTLAFLLNRNNNVHPCRISVYLNEVEARTPKIRYSAMLKQFEKAGGNIVVVRRSHTRDSTQQRGFVDMHTERDAAMTGASHYDILRYRTEEECRGLYGAKYRRRISGTEKNELRRKQGLGLAGAVGQL